MNSKDIESICSILDGWSGRLTWEALISVIQDRLGLTFTRQALDKHDRIKIAYKTRKQSLREKPGQISASSVEMQKVLERLERLKAENERLKAENSQLLEQFARWAYNAYSKGLTQEYLNRQLPNIDRDRTKL